MNVTGFIIPILLMTNLYILTPTLWFLSPYQRPVEADVISPAAKPLTLRAH